MSAPAFGQAGRDVLLPTCAQLSLEALSCVQAVLEGDTVPSCAQLPLLPTAAGWTHPLQSSMQGIYVLDFPSACA